MISTILRWAGKTSSIVVLAIGLVLACVFLFLGPVAELVVEKYDEQWTGRRIEMDKMRINLFTGGVSINDLTVFEPVKTDTFVYVRDIYTNLEWTHFLEDEYDILEIFVSHPDFSIVQNGSTFNFDDLIRRFSVQDSTTVESSEETHYRIENIHIDSARIRYRETNIGSALTVVNTNVTCPVIAWNEPAHHYEFSGDLASGGSLQFSADLDVRTLAYSLHSLIKEVNLSPFLPYVRDAIKINRMDGLVTLDFEVKGNFSNPNAIALHAASTLEQVILEDFQDDKIAGMERLNFGVDSVNTAESIYDWGAISVYRPFVKFERYTDGDNFSRLLKNTVASASGDSAVSGADYGNPFSLLIGYAADIINEYAMKDYTMDSVVISKGHIVYNDYTLNDKFFADLDSLNISSGKLNSKDTQLKFGIDARINETGVMKAKLSMDPHNLENFELIYSIEDVRLSSFSPYSVYYAAHPFWDGLIYYNNETKVLNRIIDSKNKLEIKKIEVGRKVKSSTAIDLPLRLAVAILRDPKGNINLEIPVEGNLDDPHYKLGKVIWGIISNIIVKAATSPFKLLASAIDADEDDLRSIKFEYLSDSLTNRQQKNLRMLGRVLKLKPELKIELIYKPGNNDESEMLAAFEAKKRYILKIDSLREDEPNMTQIRQIGELSINDSAFVQYMNRHLLFEGSLQPIEKCKRFVGKRRLENKMKTIIANRKKRITDFLSGLEEVKPENFALVDALENEKSDGIPKFDVRFGLADEDTPE